MLTAPIYSAPRRHGGHSRGVGGGGEGEADRWSSGLRSGAQGGKQIRLTQGKSVAKGILGMRKRREVVVFSHPLLFSVSLRFLSELHGCT